MSFHRKYGTLLVTGTTSIRIPIIKRAAVDFAVGADWTPAAGDVKVFVDAAVAANITNLPTAIASGNGAFWEFIITAAELTCKQLLVVVSDAATKAVEDQSFIVETYGNASAMYVTDLSAQLATPTNITAGTITTATNLTNLPAITANWITAAGIAAGALNGKGDWMVSYTQPIGFLAATFPAGTVANTTNITAGTITTTTNLTNLPAAAALEATLTAMKGATFAGATDSLEAIRDRGDAAWITATGFATPTNITAGTITTVTNLTTNNDKTGYALTPADHVVGADTILDRNMATGTDSGSPTVRTVRQALRFLRNKWSITAGTLTVTKEDDVTTSFTATVTTDAAAVPIVGNDPA